MSIFDLHAAVLQDYKDFVRSFFTGIEDPRCIPDFFYAPNICVFCDGRVHDQPEVAARDAIIRPALIEKGYRVVVIRYDVDLGTKLAANEDIFGRRMD